MALALSRRFKPTPLTIGRPRRPGVLALAPQPIAAEVVTTEQRKAEPKQSVLVPANIPKPVLKLAPGAARRKITDGGFAGVVPRVYEGRVAIVFATGPSLTGEVVETIRPYHEDGTVVTFGCNDAYRIVPFLDVHYACDPPWWKHHIELGTIFDHPAVKWTQSPEVRDLYGVNHIAGITGAGLSLNQALIHFGGNSGYQILNMALLYGASKMILCGYNMGVPAGKPVHFFGEHPKPMSQSTSFNSFAASYDAIKGVQRAMIINCTPESTLTQFVKRELKEVLEECRQSIALSRANQPS